jgi:hypothetical protein
MASPPTTMLRAVWLAGIELLDAMTRVGDPDVFRRIILESVVGNP